MAVGPAGPGRLRRLLDRDAAEIVVIDTDDEHVYQPGLLLVPFGLAKAASLVRPRHRQLRPGVAFLQAAVDRVDPDEKEIITVGEFYAEHAAQQDGHQPVAS